MTMDPLRIIQMYPDSRWLVCPLLIYLMINHTHDFQIFFLIHIRSPLFYLINTSIFPFLCAFVNLPLFFSTTEFLREVWSHHLVYFGLTLRKELRG